jgi:hypothetical protein
MKHKNKQETSPKVPLEELDQNGLNDPFFHLSDYSLIGGLTSPKSNEFWKSLPFVKIKQEG